MKLKIHISGILVILISILADGGEFIALFLLSAAIHELGHLLAAKLMKKRVDMIEIGFSGARIRLGTGLLGYGEEFFIAFMGPFFNFLTVGAIALIFILQNETVQTVVESGMRFLANRSGDKFEIMGFLALSSLAQAFLNILPIKSLDGGRMLHCFLSAVLGEQIGERAIEVSTLFFSFLSWMTSVYLMIKFSAGIALFVFALWVFVAVSGKGDRGVI